MTVMKAHNSRSPLLLKLLVCACVILALLVSSSIVEAVRYPKKRKSSQSSSSSSYPVSAATGGEDGTIEGTKPHIIPVDQTREAHEEGYNPTDEERERAANPKKQKSYTELSDLMVDLSKRMCNRLGPLVKTKGRQNFDYRTRCDVLYESLERIAFNLGDTMVNELDLTQQDLVDAAQTPQNYFTLVGNLKEAVKHILTAKTTSTGKIDESGLDLKLHQTLSEFILKSATQDPGHAAHMRGFARTANKNALKAGIKMPSYGLDDVDELDEENFLVGQDLAHSQNQKVDGVDAKAITEQAPDASTEEEDERLIDELSKETWLIDNVDKE